jgi:hypothetical protein
LGTGRFGGWVLFFQNTHLSVFDSAGRLAQKHKM